MFYTEADIQKYSLYWEKQFSKVLLWYYKEWSIGNTPIRNVILSAKHNSFNDIRPAKLLNPDLELHGPDDICPNEYFFSASMYYLSVIPQVICKMASPETARCYLNSSGWPAISLGLGGFMSAEKILIESNLLPCKGEVNKYVSLLRIVHPFHKKELIDYMSGTAANLSQIEYSAFCKGVKGKEEIIIAELDKCADSFINVCENIKQGNNYTSNSMYLDDNCAYYK